MAVEQAMRTIPITKPDFGPGGSGGHSEAFGDRLGRSRAICKRFEEQFCDVHRRALAAAASSCTTALHIAVAALGLKPGDEVIVPAFTWVSTANVIEYMGARPVFCDVDLRTFNIDVDQLSGFISERTVGIIPVHLFGLCVDIAPIMDLARRHHLWVVEDAACGFGAWYHGVHAGLFGDAGCFSFHPRKSITTGEGGMITTGRPELDRSTGACATTAPRAPISSAIKDGPRSAWPTTTTLATTTA